MKTKEVGYVVRIDTARTHGWQYKRHCWSGICKDEECSCRKVSSRFFADRKHKGKRRARALAQKLLRSKRWN